MSSKVALLFGFILLTPLFVFAQGLVPCSGPECQACHVIELGQRIINFLVVVAVLIAVGMFAYAGLLMVTGGGDSGKISKAKGIFTTVAIGFIVLLAGWLIIDTVMKMLYEGSALDQSTRSSFGPWNQIECVVINPGGTQWTSTSTSPTSVGGSCSGVSSGPCSVSALQSSFGSAAGAASQICSVESGGVPTVESRTDRLRSSGDAFSVGLFQVNLTVHKLSCNGKNLDCPSAFEGRNFDAVIVNRALYNECKVLAADPACNTAKAVELYNGRGGNWGDWRNSANKCSIPI